MDSATRTTTHTTTHTKAPVSRLMKRMIEGDFYLSDEEV